MNKIANIKKEYFLDHYSIVLYILVSLCFPSIYKIVIPCIVAISLVQIYRLKKGMISREYIVNTYFYLLVFSLLFFRSIHTLILIINIGIHGYFFIKNKPIIGRKKIIPEILVLIFFGLLVLNYSIHIPHLKGIETNLYLLMYPLLFISIKSQPRFIKIPKAITVYITSVLLVSIYLILINAYFHKITLSTNTYFSKYLGIIHVYYGMFLGLAIAFLLALKTIQKSYIAPITDSIIMLFLLLILVYVGARISLLAVFLISLLAIYKSIHWVWYKKGITMVLVLISLFTMGYQTIPRAKRGLDSIKKIYTSVQKNDKQDLINNSWRNMYKRYLVTKYTLTEIKENYLLGIGNKNVKNKISTKIINDGYKYFEPINTHNQYLHFLIGMGIIPFLFFIALLYYFYKNTSHTVYATYFLVFFLSIMLTESILVRIKGISLFFLFYFILFLQENKPLDV